MKDKLAEQILFKYRLKARGMTEEDMIKAMQDYHEAKMKDVTDDDIISYAKSNMKSSIPLVEAGIIVGAKAMRDGEIKHNREV